MKKDCLTTFSKVDFNTFEPEEEINLNAVAAEIRTLRPPEPYKGKGIHYEGERIRRKIGKAGAKGKK